MQPGVSWSGVLLVKKVDSWLTAPGMRRVARWILIVVAGLWIVVRFCGLETSPPGFFVDEATPALHAMCLAETGRDANGEGWQLYPRGAHPGGGEHSLTFVGFEAGWLRLFGTSRAAFRAVAGVWTLVTILGLFLVARELARTRPMEHVADGPLPAFPGLVLLASLLSPWGFQFSRVAWDAPLAPAFGVLSLFAILRCLRSGRAWLAWSLAAGISASAAVVSYAPFRVVMPLLFLASLGGVLVARADAGERRRRVGRLLVGAAAAFVLLLPTLSKLATGTINARMNTIGIWNEGWLSEHAGHANRAWFLVGTFLDNVVAHFSPTFLFFSGDRNWRHSAQVFGQLSWLDILALGLVVWRVLAVLRAWLCHRPPRFATSALPAERALVLAGIGGMAGVLIGVVPAALTWEGVPTALRSIGAWPFVALSTGAVLAWAWARSRWTPPVLAIVALGFSAHFLPHYFRAYRTVAHHWFMRAMPEVIEQERRVDPSKPIARIVADNLGASYSYDQVSRYYLMSLAKMTCKESEEAVQTFWEEARGERPKD
jgi:hypothetical protein